MREQGGGVLFQPFLVDHESWAQQPLRLQRRGKLRKIFVVRLVYNWWTIFMRLGIPGKHAEAITSRPLALQGVARQTRHGNQTTVEITSTHAQAAQIAGALTKVSAFLKRIKATAEQLTQGERWRLILSAAFRQFLGGKVIGSPGRLADAPA